MQDESYDNLKRRNFVDYGRCMFKQHDANTSMGNEAHVFCLDQMRRDEQYREGMKRKEKMLEHFGFLGGDVVAHDNTEPKTPVSTFSILDLTQEDYKLLIEALGMAVTCKEVEVDVAQAEADSKADTLRDLVVLKRKLETA